MNASRRHLPSKAVLGCFALAASAVAIAQEYPPNDPPTFSAVPSPAITGNPLQLQFGTIAFPSAVGIWGTYIEDHVVVVFFDYFCGFICPGGDPYYQIFSTTTPVLDAGDYVVRFQDGWHDPPFEFPLHVERAPVSTVPAIEGAGILAMTGLILLVRHRLQRLPS